MKLGIMQPYFFPYIGYFSLIKHVDKFILLDDVQFIRHGWIERNRILKPTDGWQYFRVPLKKHHRETRIKNIEINNNISWKKRIIAQLEHYKNFAPYYIDVISLLNQLFESDFDNIVILDKDSLIKICEYLGIETQISVFSDLNLTIETVSDSDEWALNISKAMNACEYWNPPGGKEFFNKTKFEKNNIQLCFHECKLPVYDQQRTTFMPGLSILDTMMFIKPDQINEMLDEYELS